MVTPPECQLSPTFHDRPNIDAAPQPVWHCTRCHEYVARDEADPNPPACLVR